MLIVSSSMEGAGFLKSVSVFHYDLGYVKTLYPCHSEHTSIKCKEDAVTLSLYV